MSQQSQGTDSVERLGKALADAACLAAVDYLQKHGLTADAEALAACVRAHAKAAIPAAIKDGRAAMDARMGEALAWQTMAATMALAGIEAAKEAGFHAARPKEGQS